MKPFTEELLDLFVSGTKKIFVAHVTFADGTTKRYLHRDIGNPDEIGGLSYEKRLVELEGLKDAPFSRETNRMSATFSNVTNDDTPGEWGLIAASADYPARMSKVDFYTYLPETNEFLWYWDGYGSQLPANEATVKMTVIDQKEAAGFCFANQTISARNGFVNPDPDESTPPFGGDDNIGGGENPIGGYCFVRGTSVHSDFNESRFNHNFEIGDEILSFNPDTMEVTRDVIAKVHRKIVDKYLSVKFANGVSIGVTENHRFFTEDGKFVSIKKIKLGTLVYWFSDGYFQLIKLEEKEEIHASIEVINFSVEKNQTYFADGFAVHNRKPEPIDLPGDQQIQF
jgi:hypothetical protein